MGGSQGAQALNSSIVQNLEQIKAGWNASYSYSRPKRL